MRDDFRGPRKVAAPYIIAGVLIAFVCWEIVLVTFASRSFEGPDDPNYYKMGLTYDRQMASRRQGWRVEGNLPDEVPSGQPLRLEARVLDPSGAAVAERVVARVGRPATRTQDRQMTLPTDWVPEQGWWDVTYLVGGQPLGRTRLHVR